MGVVFSPLRRLTSLRRGEPSRGGGETRRDEASTGGRVGVSGPQGRTWREGAEGVGRRRGGEGGGGERNTERSYVAYGGRESRVKLTKMTRHLLFVFALPSSLHRPTDQRCNALEPPTTEKLQSGISARKNTDLTNRARSTEREREIRSAKGRRLGTALSIVERETIVRYST